VATTADVRVWGLDGDRRVRSDEVARLQIVASGIAVPDPDFAREDERLGSAAGRGEPSIDEKLVET
jgi:hypothetical protein